MEIGIDSFGAVISDQGTGLMLSPVQRTQNLLEEIALADKVGLDVFGVGEHHRSEFVDSAPVVILAAAATRTQRIRLTSAVTVLSGRRSGSGLSRGCYSGFDIQRSCRNRCRTRIVCRGLSTLRFRFRRLRFAFRGEA